MKKVYNLHPGIEVGSHFRGLFVVVLLLLFYIPATFKVRLVIECIYGDFIVLPHWETRSANAMA